MLGIDVSDHNDIIDWKLVKNQIKFCMIRAGMGNEIREKNLEANVQGCEANSIPYGFYWFSYAKDKKDAIAEAKTCIRRIKNFHPVFPVTYDFEYATETWGNSQGVRYTNELRIEIISAFLDAIAFNGYTPMLYTNYDYIIYRGLNKIIKKYPLWFSYTLSDKKPNISCDIWQYSYTGKINGINTEVDLNNCYKDYFGNYLTNMLESVDSNLFEVFFKNNTQQINRYKEAIKYYIANDKNISSASTKYNCDSYLMEYIIKKLKENKSWQF